MKTPAGHKLLKNVVFKASIVYALVGSLPSVISFLLLPIYLNHLTPEDYGILSLLATYVAFYEIVGSLHLNIAAETNYFKQEKKSSFEKQLFTSTIVISFFSFLLFSVTSHAGFDLLSSQQKLTFFPLGFIVLLTATLKQSKTIFFVFLRNKYNLRAFIFYSVASSALNFSIQYYLIVYEKLGVLGSVLGSMIGTICIALILFVKERNLFTLSISRTVIRDSLALSLPLIPAIAVRWALNFGDRLLLERYMTLGDVGIYTLLVKILSVSTLFFQAFVLAIRPGFYQLISNPIENKAALEKIIALFSSVTILAVALTLSVGFQLDLITTSERFLKMKDYLPLAMLCLVPKLLVRLPRLDLFYQKKTGLVSLYTFINAFFMITIALLTVDRYGVYGLLLGVSIGALAECILSYKHFFIFKYNISFATRTLPMAVFFLSLAALIGLLEKEIIHYRLASSCILSMAVLMILWTHKTLLFQQYKR